MPFHTRIVHKARLCSLCLAMIIFLSNPTYSEAQDVEIYTDSTAQVIRGFGAAFIEFWQPDLTAANVETAFGLGEDQLGLSILRLGINPNPNQWGENLEAAQQATEMGALIFASPWNAPADLLKAKINPGDPDTVDVAKYDAYAQHLSDFNTFMEANGVDLYAISIQNEPDYAEGWTGWSAENMVKFLRENAPSVGARIMAPESFQFRRAFTDPILNDSLAAAHTDIIGGHIYGGGNASYPLAEAKGKEVWMTEYLLNLNTGNISTPWNEFSDEERWAETMEMLRTIHTSMAGNMNAYVWWYLKRYYSFLGDGEFREAEGQPTKRGIAFSQFSKFVRPGYVRLHSDGPFGRGYLRVYTTAYIDPASQKMVIVAINDESAEKEINVAIDNLTSAVFRRYITSVDQDQEQLEAVTVDGSTFTVTLPPQTVTTFVSDEIRVSNEALPELPSGYGLNQNFPNPFNPSTVISYQVPVSGAVSLRVFDVLGREVATLVDGPVHAGNHQARFDASGLPSGVYFYTLDAGDFTTTKRMLLIR